MLHFNVLFQVSVVMNVASQCGYTQTNYEQFVALQEELFYTKKFLVMAFPCNQFGGQEPQVYEHLIISTLKICQKIKKDVSLIIFPLILGLLNVYIISFDAII